MLSVELRSSVRDAGARVGGARDDTSHRPSITGRRAWAALRLGLEVSQFSPGRGCGSGGAGRPGTLVSASFSQRHRILEAI